jgi:predicted DNA-binding protein
MKLQVMVSDELAERIDKLCEYIGSTRSSVCASIIALALPEWEKSYYSNDESQDTQIEYEQLKIQ